MHLLTPFSFLIIVLLSGTGVEGAISTNATCATTFSWATNSMNQSPCLVAAYLQGACNAGDWRVPALPQLSDDSKLAYNPPNQLTKTYCSCSWAVYNLISACAACQHGGWNVWPVWNVACMTPIVLVSPQAWPSSIPVPPDTVIPAYAATDPQTWNGALFDVAQAQAIGSQDYIPNMASITDSSTIDTSTSSTPAPSSGGSSGPPVGPIVGGVVGGVLGILLIAVLGVFLLCPRIFRRGNSAHGHSSKQEITSSAPPTPMNIAGRGTIHYDTATVSTTRQQLLAPTSSRPPIDHRHTSTYSVGTSVDHSVAPLGPVHQGSPLTLSQNPVTSISSAPSNTASVYSTLPKVTPPASTPSIRSFFTRVTSRQGHAHTPSDTSITSSTTLFQRGPQAFQRQQRPGDEIDPYILPSSPGGAPTKSRHTAPFSNSHPVDRKQRLPGLRYSPPPPASPVESPTGASPSVPHVLSAPIVLVSDDQSTVGVSSPSNEVYGMLPSIMNGDIDRRINMSPANASSILEAAPPYSTEVRHDPPIARTQLPVVKEYPEEKARYDNTSPEM